MKFSDKALRQIGRKLLERTDRMTLQEDAPYPEKPGSHARSPRPWTLGRQRKAAVLTFRKRLR